MAGWLEWGLLNLGAWTTAGEDAGVCIQASEYPQCLHSTNQLPNRGRVRRSRHNSHLRSSLVLPSTVSPSVNGAGLGVGVTTLSLSHRGYF
ncbi:hypothetical protein B0T24DRAFT_635987 [Lasiosphaeria ovina]|uniref:Secreted protein n=1 Tax=Lasiosphaeria ovina TaxID=92902 RepID=A0AAE0MZN9_9PEZI|nr:hypothetical protein B0T24DRAFT_635987 [Lasiosphaeria ovina]